MAAADQIRCVDAARVGSSGRGRTEPEAAVVDAARDAGAAGGPGSRWAGEGDMWRVRVEAPDPGAGCAGPDVERRGGCPGGGHGGRCRAMRAEGRGLGMGRAGPELGLGGGADRAWQPCGRLSPWPPCAQCSPWCSRWDRPWLPATVRAGPRIWRLSRLRTWRWRGGGRVRGGPESGPGAGRRGRSLRGGGGGRRCDRPLRIQGSTYPPFGPGPASGRSLGQGSDRCPGPASGRSLRRCSGRAPGRCSGRAPGRCSGRTAWRASG